MFSASAVILLIVLLLRQDRALHQQQDAAENQNQDLIRLGNQLLDEMDAQQDASTQQIHTANQSLMTTLSQLGQSQSSILESMQRQVLLSTRNQEEHSGRMSAALHEDMNRIDTRLEQLRMENERQLTEMRKTVDQKLTETLDRKLNASFSQVSERLESVYRGLGEMHALAASVGDLKKVMTNVKTRGIWGEMLLGNLIRQSLAPGQYEENVEIIPGSGERVEFAIRLPDRGGSPLLLPVDSKFPQESYIRMTEASREGKLSSAENARKELIRRIREEARRISEKYISPPASTDFAIMFLPVEGLYAEVLQDPELPESVQREYRVVIAGPGTFSAMLNALQMGFRTLAIEKRSSEVWQLLGEIKTDFGHFSQMLIDTRKRLDQAGETIDSAVNRTRSIQRKLSDVEEEKIN